MAMVSFGRKSLSGIPPFDKYSSNVPIIVSLLQMSTMDCGLPVALRNSRNENGNISQVKVLIAISLERSFADEPVIYTSQFCVVCTLLMNWPHLFTYWISSKKKVDFLRVFIWIHTIISISDHSRSN